MRVLEPIGGSVKHTKRKPKRTNVQAHTYTWKKKIPIPNSFFFFFFFFFFFLMLKPQKKKIFFFLVCVTTASVWDVATSHTSCVHSTRTYTHEKKNDVPE